jgi:hypothetical protein
MSPEPNEALFPSKLIPQYTEHSFPSVSVRKEDESHESDVIQAEILRMEVSVGARLPMAAAFLKREASPSAVDASARLSAPRRVAYPVDSGCAFPPASAFHAV